MLLPIRTHQCNNERNHNSSDARESGASTKSHIPMETKQLLSIMSNQNVCATLRERSFLLTEKLHKNWEILMIKTSGTIGNVRMTFCNLREVAQKYLGTHRKDVFH